jgi:hypothetical protein
LLLPAISEAAFQYVADYPAVDGSDAPKRSDGDEPKRPMLRLLESA